MRAHPFRTEGGAPTTKPIPTPTRRGTPPGCECVPDPFAPRAVLLQQSQSQLRPVGAPAPGANACLTPFAPRAVLLQQNQTQLRPVGAPVPGANACPPVRTEAVLLRGPTTKPHPNADNPPPTPPTPP